MNLLFLTPQLPYPPRQGATIRNYNLIRLLARSHTIDLFTFLAPGEKVEPDSPLRRLCRRIAWAPQPDRPSTRRALDTLMNPRPDMALRLDSPAAHTQVARLLAQAADAGAPYDLVQVEGIEMGAYGLQALAEAAPSRPPLLIFDDHNVEYLLQKRAAQVDARSPRRWPAALYSHIQWRKLRRYERMLCQRAARVIAVSPHDREALASLAPGSPVHTIPNAVDLDLYAPASPAERAWPPHLLFTGKMDYRPNVDAVLWFAQEVLPRIQRQAEAAGLPPARFQIVGMTPHPRLRALAGRPHIEITGAVPEISPYLAAATVYVVPMRVGGGTRFKVLEALASATPTVATSLGVEGLGVTQGREVLIGDSAAEFAAAVVRLLVDASQDGALGRALGVAGRAFVAAHYSWEQIAPRLEEVYAQALGGQRRAAN